MALANIEKRRAYDSKRGVERRKNGYIAPQIRYNMQRVNELKETTPCKDCGGSFPAVCMDFDHLHDKVQEVSRLVADGRS